MITTELVNFWPGTAMPQYLAALMIVLLIATVLSRVLLLRRTGTQAMHFGKLDKTDFLIPPVALFYFYTVFAAAFGWPLASSQTFFQSTAVAWLGVGLCLAAVLILALSLVSFGKSFRVGIDVDQPGRLVTTGIFARSRNPIYVGFFLFLVGQLLVFPNWVPLFYLVGGTVLFHRQVLREEEFMRQHYGQEYADYCSRVRRYV
jgi:protein-S-isoprenylcysteine O-methyltransferase Ste14